MVTLGVLVVGETPSLGRSIADLLESSDVPTQYVPDLQSGQPLPETCRVVVAACNGPYCATGRRWARGELPNVELVLVGSRDPAIVGSDRLHLVELPLLPPEFLSMVRGLLQPSIGGGGPGLGLS
jgi:hypothetical protein